MNIKLLLILILSFECLISNGQEKQIIIKNKMDNTPISFVHVLSNSGSVKSISDVNGKVELDMSLLSNPSDTIYISHISFEEKKLSIADFLLKKEILLTPKVFELSEVTLVPVDKQTVYSHYVITAFFMSWQVENKVLEYYMDGIVEYHIPLKGKRETEVLIKQFRAFKNKKLIKSKQKMVTLYTIPNIPIIKKLPLTKRLDKRFEIATEKNKKGGNDIVATQDGKIVGITYKNAEGNEVKTEVDFIWNETDYKKTFGYSYRYEDAILMEDYSPDLFLDSIPYLKRSKKYERESMKHKKEIAYRKAKKNTELYTLDIRIEGEATYQLLKKEFKRSKKILQNPFKKSHYDKPYWEKQPYYKSLYTPIKNKLHKTLMELPN